MLEHVKHASKVVAKVVAAIALGAIPVLFLEGLRQAAEVSFSWSSLIISWVFVTGVWLAAWLGQPYSLNSLDWVLPWPGIVIVAVGGLVWLAYIATGATSAAWVALAALYGFLIALDTLFANAAHALQRWGVHIVLALAGGATPVLVAQVASRFSEEEFFVALHALALCAFWLLLLVLWRWLFVRAPVPTRRGFSFNARDLGILLLLFACVGLVITVRAYQQSFYPSQAPAFEGISAATPFLCGSTSPDEQTFEGKDVFRRLLARVEANPYKRAPEYGMLALGTGNDRWADAFHSRLLSEAEQRAFTGPANSVKSIQYDAALRAYYFSRVRIAFPGLFNVDEEDKLRQWFASINRRALTTEWVDWMYAIAFSKWPEGPYENQENGAGLLALLESTGLAAPDLSPMNRDYLERNRRGWGTGFRNTDDAFTYQPGWITNAFFQSLFMGQPPQKNARLGFEWMLFQALPDGSSLHYNYPNSASLAGIAYLGARLLGDARYIWLSGRALSDLETRGAFLYAQPGAEQAVGLVGRSPTQGSCLLYGNSGLPNQAGPLSPDKIIFRDGWSKDATYLLLNLRFTGWHRYKGTNTVTLLYQNGPLVSGGFAGKPFTWLPMGRRLFRDKRIPRENLNGLLVERFGMNAVIYGLIGAAGPWSQDPPYFARVTRFETSAGKNVSTTELEGWHGWQDKRTVHFYHEGPVIIVDDARGPAGRAAALTWHITGDGQVQDRRIWLRGGEHPAEMLLLPIGAGQVRVEKSRQVRDSSMRVIYNSPKNGRLAAVTLFLLKEWVGAHVEMTRQEGQTILQVTQEGKRITVPLALDNQARDSDLGR
jgi:hypothetical protein